MRILTLKFEESEPDRNYDILLDVFKYSVKKNMPGVRIETIVPPLPPVDGDKTYFMTKNTVKLGYWIDEIVKSDEETIIMDCDMLLLRNISDAFAYDFDIAITRRDNYYVPYNGGMIFVRPNSRSIEFLLAWKEVNQKMYEDPVFHQPWRKKYAGMNQASLGWAIENIADKLSLISLPCEEWNICQEDWGKINESSRCVHIKSRLRKAIFADNCNGNFKTAFDLWNKYKEEMLESTGD